ncbi:uncharacterized protein LOC120124088 [Hibiscus syriacus]|uniref:uncharacterized protein LOC120124088 n=1 Tax=Hibiscus syriacus TaxID=106335 RepID=UPI0019207C58|nr:uncharacterized protein LOC120124088 [Hibiscus syriacus]
MADNFSSCIIGAMDRLWFHQTILHSQPFSLFPNKTLKPQQPYSESPLSSRSESSLAEKNIPASFCPVPDPEPLTPSEEEEKWRKELEEGVLAPEAFHILHPHQLKRIKGITFTGIQLHVH